MSPRTLFERQMLRSEMLDRGIRLPANIEYGKGARAALWTRPEDWAAVSIAADKVREHFGGGVLLSRGNFSENDATDVLFVNAVVTMSAEEYMALEAPFEEWWVANIDAANLLHSVEFR